MAKRQDKSSARDLLRRLIPTGDIEEILTNIRKSLSGGQVSLSKFLSGTFRFPILLAFLVAFFNQMSGVNFVLYYAPRIFEQAGIEAEAVLGASVPIGIVNLIFTLLGMYLIDNFGRKKLLYIGSFGYISSLAGVSWAFFSEAQGVVVVVFVCAFIASHAVGQGAVIWVFISEIFPNSVRDFGMSLGSGTHWVMAALITLLTPTVLSTFTGGQIFAFFSGMMVLQLLFVWLIMPETKGLSLEEMEIKLGMGADTLEEEIGVEPEASTTPL
jgi:predicted MFS family arabinose efflux permease